MRVVTFADGFVSTTPPELQGEVSENYDLLNNQVSAVDIDDFIVDGSDFKSVFINYEIERIGASTYRQAGSLLAVFNGTWSLTFGNYQGNQIFNDAIESSENVVLSIGPASGQFSYISGDLPGHTSSKLKMFITRVAA